MKTYLLYQNGKLIVKDKQENNKKLSKIIPNFKKKSQPVLQQPVLQQPVLQQPILQQPIQTNQNIQKYPSLVPPPLTDSLKNTNIPHLFNNSLKSFPKKDSLSVSTIQSKNKKTKVNELQFDLFSKLCKIINIDSNNPLGSEIPFEKLQDNDIIRKLYDIQDKLKDVFPSSKLTALHTNALKKQSFPGVNIVRQIFKEMGYKLRPINTSEGYVGGKKILSRVYHIEKL
jgi:hypothetical protein